MRIKIIKKTFRNFFKSKDCLKNHKIDEGIMSNKYGEQRSIIYLGQLINIKKSLLSLRVEKYKEFYRKFSRLYKRECTDKIYLLNEKIRGYEMNIKISVIIPVYNGEKYVEKCLYSVLNQTLKEIEIIVINDGSKDKTKDIIEKYSNIKNINIINKKNEGASKSRNLGIDLAKGEYIYFIDADDYIENVAFEKLYAQAKKENLDIIVFDYYNETPEKKNYIKNLDIKENEIISGKKYAQYLLQSEKRIVPAIWGKLIKRSAYIENNIRFSEHIFIGEDVVLGIKIAYYVKRVGKVNEALYHYILHEEQGTKTVEKNKELADLWNGINEIENFFKNKLEYACYKKGVERKRIGFYFKLGKEIKKIKEINQEWIKKIEEIKGYEDYKKMKLYKKLKLYFILKLIERNF